MLKNLSEKDKEAIDSFIKSKLIKDLELPDDDTLLAVPADPNSDKKKKPITLF